MSRLGTSLFTLLYLPLCAGLAVASVVTAGDYLISARPVVDRGTAIGFGILGGFAMLGVLVGQRQWARAGTVEGRRQGLPSPRFFAGVLVFGMIGGAATTWKALDDQRRQEADRNSEFCERAMTDAPRAFDARHPAPREKVLFCIGELERCRREHPVDETVSISNKRIQYDFDQRPDVKCLRESAARAGFGPTPSR